MPLLWQLEELLAMSKPVSKYIMSRDYTRDLALKSRELGKETATNVADSLQTTFIVVRTSVKCFLAQVSTQASTGRLRYATNVVKHHQLRGGTFLCCPTLQPIPN